MVLLFDELPIGLAPVRSPGRPRPAEAAFPPNTWFAVFKVYTEGTRVLQSFTSDPARLTSAVQAATLGDDARSRTAAAPNLQALEPTPSSPPAQGQPPPDLAPVPKDLANAVSPAVAADLAELSQRVQTYDSFYALMAISRSLAPVRGRKSVIYFGEAREVPESYSVTYDSMVSVANRANVTIHTVDARGLNATRIGGRSAFDQAIGQFSATGGSGGGTIGNAPATVNTEAGDRGGGGCQESGLKLHQLSGSFSTTCERHWRPGDRQHQRPRGRPRRRGRGARSVLRGRLHTAEPGAGRQVPADRGEGEPSGRPPADARRLLRDGRQHADAGRVRAASDGGAGAEGPAARLRARGGHPAVRAARPRARDRLPVAGAARGRRDRARPGRRQLQGPPRAPRRGQGRGGTRRRTAQPGLAGRGHPGRSRAPARDEPRLPPRAVAASRPLQRRAGAAGPAERSHQRLAHERRRRSRSRRPRRRQPHGGARRAPGGRRERQATR